MSVTPSSRVAKEQKTRTVSVNENGVFLLEEHPDAGYSQVILALGWISQQDTLWATCRNWILKGEKPIPC